MELPELGDLSIEDVLSEIEERDYRIEFADAEVGPVAVGSVTRQRNFPSATRVHLPIASSCRSVSKVDPHLAIWFC